MMMTHMCTQSQMSLFQTKWLTDAFPDDTCVSFVGDPDVLAQLPDVSLTFHFRDNHLSFWRYHLKLWRYHLKLWRYHLKFWRYHLKFWRYHLKFWRYHLKFWRYHLKFWRYHLKIEYSAHGSLSAQIFLLPPSASCWTYANTLEPTKFRLFISVKHGTIEPSLKLKHLKFGGDD